MGKEHQIIYFKTYNQDFIPLEERIGSLERRHALCYSVKSSMREINNLPQNTRSALSLHENISAIHKYTQIFMH